LAETGNLRDLAAESHRLLGQVHARREQWPESEAELGNALEIARNLGSPSLEWRARKALATVYQAQGKSEAAEAEFAAAAAIVRDLSQRVGTDAAQDAFLARPEIQVVIEHGAGQ
jgi:tetratricopeptide (TPR) repeat protein